MSVITEVEMRSITKKIVKVDAAFAPVIKASPLCTIARKKYNRSHFETLVNSIISQQLAVKAADTIIKRVNLLVDEKPQPEKFLNLSDDQLRSVGVSGAKTRSIKELAAAIDSGKLNFHKYPKLTNNEISAELTQIWELAAGPQKCS